MMLTSSRSRRNLRIATAISFTGCAIALTSRSNRETSRSISLRYDANGKAIAPSFPKLKSREAQIKALKQSALDPNEEYDLLVVGGGATGTGVALDAVTRGLKVALVDANDFASGTSSKSTKLIHGGVRYLEKAFWELDYSQYKLVKEALRERSSFVNVAPHLTSWMPIMIPIQQWWKAPYMWAGTKAYDLLSGFAKSSYCMGKSATLTAFPNLDNKNLLGSLVYYDGMHNDARMNVTLAISAAAFGATVANYVKVESLTTRADGQLDGATVINQIADETGRKERFAIKAKGIINATGPFTDSLRQMADPQAADIVAPSSGTHLVLPARFGPGNLGVLDPATSDGRVLFLLPWLGHMIAGTTDDACALTQEPAPQGEEIAWILRELNRYMRPGFKIGPEDVLSAWTGIRPLVRDPSKSASQGLVRNHLITKSENGLITIAGGKWTTYRQMAEETIDEAIKDFRLDHKVRDGYDLPLLTGSVEYEEPVKPDRNCQTLGLKLIGAHGWSPELSKSLSKRSGLESDVSEHLATAYGDRAWQVSQLCDSDNDLVQGARLAPHLPFVDAEVLHAIRSEYAQTIVDVVSRRMRLAFLDVAAARTALPEISRIMCTELGWNTERQQQEEREALQFLKTMGSDLIKTSHKGPQKTVA